MKKYIVVYLPLIISFCFSIQSKADCTKPPLPADYIDVTSSSYGATPDDDTDDTAAIQKAINETPEGGTLYIPSGTYKINPIFLAGAHGISLHKNMVVWMDADAILSAIPVATTQYTVISLIKVKNVTIIGGQIKGDRYSHLDDKGEKGYGIGVWSSKNIKIQNLLVKDSWGDGIYIAEFRNKGDAPREPDMLTENIAICGVIADNNRRQGLSVAAADHVIVEESKFINSNGASVCSGIDLEPNPDPDTCPQCLYTRYKVSNVTIRNCEITGNSHAGISVYRANSMNAIEHNLIKSNGRSGIRIYEGNGTTILKNWIGDNGKSSTDNGNFADIEMERSTNTLVKLNTLRDSTPYNQAGIWLQGFTTGNVLIDNDICIRISAYAIRDDSLNNPFVESGNTYCARNPYADRIDIVETCLHYLLLKNTLKN